MFMSGYAHEGPILARKERIKQNSRAALPSKVAEVSWGETK